MITAITLTQNWYATTAYVMLHRLDQFVDLATLHAILLLVENLRAHFKIEIVQQISVTGQEIGDYLRR